MWTAKSRVTDGHRIGKEEEETSSRGTVSSSIASTIPKGTPKKRDSAEEIRVTTRPLPKPQKPPRRGSDKSNKSDKSRRNSREKPSPLGEELKSKSGTTSEQASREPERMRVKFDLQDSAKTYQRNALHPGKESRPTSPRRKRWCFCLLHGLDRPSSKSASIHSYLLLRPW